MVSAHLRPSGRLPFTADPAPSSRVPSPTTAPALATSRSAGLPTLPLLSSTSSLLPQFTSSPSASSPLSALPSPSPPSPPPSPALSRATTCAISSSNATPSSSPSASPSSCSPPLPPPHPLPHPPLPPLLLPPSSHPLPSQSPSPPPPPPPPPRPHCLLSPTAQSSHVLESQVTLTRVTRHPPPTQAPHSLH
ncbi:unnamed protein product [Closterium sp. Yama58-4]|nr:unnamed protein product [Closterium sp. Yama58-4]